MKAKFRLLSEEEHNRIELKLLREERKKLMQDVAYLLRRASMAGHCSWREDREEGVSSNALVRWAYGGKAPTDNEKPLDQSDLDACLRAVAGLPAHRHMPWLDQCVERYALELSEERGTDEADGSPMDTAERPA